MQKASGGLQKVMSFPATTEEIERDMHLHGRETAVTGFVDSEEEEA